MQEPMKIQIQSTDKQGGKSIKEIVEEFSENLEWHLKLTELNGKIKKSQYDSYVLEGFTDDQAMFLIR